MPEASTRATSKQPTRAGEAETSSHLRFAALIVVAHTRLILFHMLGSIRVGAHVLLPRILGDMGFRVGWPLGWSNA